MRMYKTMFANVGKRTFLIHAILSKLMLEIEENMDNFELKPVRKPYFHLKVCVISFKVLILVPYSS